MGKLKYSGSADKALTILFEMGAKGMKFAEAMNDFSYLYLNDHDNNKLYDLWVEYLDSVCQAFFDAGWIECQKARKEEEQEALRQAMRRRETQSWDPDAYLEDAVQEAA